MSSFVSPIGGLRKDEHVNNSDTKKTNHLLRWLYFGRKNFLSEDSHCGYDLLNNIFRERRMPIQKPCQTRE